MEADREKDERKDECNTDKTGTEKKIPMETGMTKHKTSPV